MTEFDQTSAAAKATEDDSFAWVNLLLSGAMTWEQAEALKAWRMASPQHEEAFVEAVRFRRAMRQAIAEERQDSASSPVTPLSNPARRIAPRLSRRSLVGGALAASAVGYLAIREPGGFAPSWSELTADYHTGTGQQRQIAASPGVSMELNTQTNVSRLPNTKMAGIELISGEAAIDAKRPGGAAFTIATGDGRILLTDGAVNVRAEHDAVCVTCVQGAVDIIHPAGQLRLQSGSQVTYTPHRLGPVGATDVALVTAWRKGVLIFRDTPLRQVVAELNRYRPGKIVLVDAQLAQRPVYGVFQIRQIGRAVEQVRDLTGARVVNLPGGLALLS